MTQGDADKHNAEFMRNHGYSEKDTPRLIRAAAKVWATLQRARWRLSVWLLGKATNG